MNRESLLKMAKELQDLGKYFADRSNRDSTLTALECQAIVKRCTNGGNVLETVAKSMPDELKEKSNVDHG